MKDNQYVARRAFHGMLTKRTPLSEPSEFRPWLCSAPTVTWTSLRMLWRRTRSREVGRGAGTQASVPAGGQPVCLALAGPPAGS